MIDLKYAYAVSVNIIVLADTVPPVISASKPSTRPPSPPLPRECGASPVGRVIGGEDAKLGNWPWQVKLRENKKCTSNS